MANNDAFRKYVEAAAVLGQLTRARAEEVVRELVGAGEVQRDQAQQWVDDLLERSRRTSEELVEFVRREVSSQLSSLGMDPEHLANQVADILRRSAAVGRQAAEAARSAAGRPRPTGGVPARPAKRAPAKKKAAPKKAPAKKKAAPKKATPKKAAPTKKAAPKKATPTKAAAKKAPPKPSAAGS